MKKPVQAKEKTKVMTRITRTKIMPPKRSVDHPYAILERDEMDSLKMRGRRGFERVEGMFASIFSFWKSSKQAFTDAG